MVKEVFKKKIGNYLVGRTIGEVQQPLLCAVGGRGSGSVQRIAVCLRCSCLQGTYAKVRYGKHCEADEHVAIKVTNTPPGNTEVTHGYVHSMRY